MSLLQPRNFSWLVEGKLAGLARPCSMSELEYLRDQGVKHIVTLTESPLSTELTECNGLVFTHLPVSDFTPPTLQQVDDFLKIVEERNSKGEAVAVHCAYGQGRVGTMLACYLVKSKPCSANDAIHIVRTKRPGSIETIEQEKLVGKFAATLSNK